MTNHSVSDPGAWLSEHKRKSLPREEVRQAFSEITEQQLGGGVLLFRKRPWEEDKDACHTKRCGRRCIASMNTLLHLFRPNDRQVSA